jgi:hypothetical protein
MRYTFYFLMLDYTISAETQFILVMIMHTQSKKAAVMARGLNLAWFLHSENCLFLPKCR